MVSSVTSRLDICVAHFILRSQIQPFDFSLTCSNTIASYNKYTATLETAARSPDKFNQALANRSPRRSPISGYVSPKSSPTNETKRRRVSREFPDITFLGTSSTYASTYRSEQFPLNMKNSNTKFRVPRCASRVEIEPPHHGSKLNKSKDSDYL